MTFDPTTVLGNIQTTLQGVSGIGNVVIGEPFSPPDADRLTTAIFCASYEPAGVTLTTTIDVFEVTLRVYSRAGMTPVDASTVEQNVAKTYFLVLSTLAGKFTLGGQIRAIDWAGEEAGRKVTGKWGHVVIGGTIFRVVDISVPLIVDDSSTFAA